MRSTSIRDLDDFVAGFRGLAGARVVGAVVFSDGIELVFDNPGVGALNLVTLFDDGSARAGQVAFGFVCDEWVEAGYGAEEPVP